MPEQIPSDLAQLLSAGTPAARDAAWQRFIASYSRLILSVARSLHGSYDAVMDRYAFILDQLRRDDFRKLRGYRADARARFTTWLVVVCRRLCLDEHRMKYGRARSGSDVIRLKTRRNLADSLVANLELESIPSPERPASEALEARQVQERLTACLLLLPAQDRMIVKLRFEDELSAAEIARVIHWPSPFHVYRRLNRLLAELRAALLEEPPRDSKTAASRPFHLG